MVQDGPHAPSSALALAHLNQEGVRLSKMGDKQGAVEVWTTLLDRVQSMHLQHRELHVCFCNRSSALLALGKARQALEDAQQALVSMKGQIPGVPLRRHPYYGKALLRQGMALISLENYAGAQIVLEEGLNADPMHLELRQALEHAIRHQQAQIAQATQQQQQQTQEWSHEGKGADNVDAACFSRKSNINDGSTAAKVPFEGRSVEERGDEACVWDGEDVEGIEVHHLKVQLQNQRDQHLIVGASSNDAEAKQMMQVMQASDPMTPLVKQLTARKAEVEQYTRDTYNYLTIQADIAMPKRLLESFVHDEPHLKALQDAIFQCVDDIRGSCNDCRVLVLGSGMGIIPMLALQAGAAHVTVIDRWLYVASACKEVLLHNNMDPASFTIMHARPTDVHISKQFPVPCNLLIADGLLDDGLLTSGLLPCVTHCLDHLMLPGSSVIPASATVYAQPVEVSLLPVCGGLELTALDTFRWQALPSRAPKCLKPLGDPQLAWQLDFRTLPQESQIRSIPTCITQPGMLNAVAYWYDLRLYACVHHSTAPLLGPAPGKGSHTHSPSLPARQSEAYPSIASWLQPAVHYLMGGAAVAAGDTVALLVAQNMFKLTFALEMGKGAKQLSCDVGQGKRGGNTPTSLSESHSSSSSSSSSSKIGTKAATSTSPIRWNYLFSSEPSLPRKHFAAAADETRLSAYDAAIQSAIARIRARGEQVHALDLGCGCGSLALLAARAGADSVTGVEAHPALVTVARRNAALNGLSSKVCIVHGDCQNMQSGRHVPWDGANLLVMDLFDETLLGGGVLRMLRAAARRGLIAKNAEIVPERASMYMMGMQVLSLAAGAVNSDLDAAGYQTEKDADEKAAPAHHSASGGSVLHAKESGLLSKIDLGPINKYRWDDAPQAVRLSRVPHTPLTPIIHLWDIDFCAVAASGPSLQGITAAAHTVSTTGAEVSRFGGEQVVRARGSSAAATASVPATQQGVLNSACLWFTLQLNDSTSITSAEVGMEQKGEGSQETKQGEVQQQQEQSSPSFWGQALLYLDLVLPVEPGQMVQLGAKREGPAKVVVMLRPGKGVIKAPRPPWKEPWGGGVSIENPHVQRVEYCRLLEAEYMQRLPLGRGHAVERDVQVVASHCGSLQLDPHSLMSSYARLALMDRLYRGRQGYASAQEVQGVMGPSAAAHCPNAKDTSGADFQAAVAPSILSLELGFNLNNVSSPYLADPVPQVPLEDVLGSRALEW